MGHTSLVRNQDWLHGAAILVLTSILATLLWLSLAYPCQGLV
jgi:hypothetical protein